MSSRSLVHINPHRHAQCRMRRQPLPDEIDPDVLHDHIAELRGELASVGGGRRSVHMRTEMDARVLRGQIEVLNDQLAQAYIKQAGVPAEDHASNCAVNQAPASRPGACDCGAAATRAIAAAAGKTTRRLGG